jgi:hypothetical protein
MPIGFNEIIANLSLPTSAALIEALPVIVSLIIIEGLLSVDNALAIAAMANHLPERQEIPRAQVRHHRRVFVSRALPGFRGLDYRKPVAQDLRGGLPGLPYVRPFPWFERRKVQRSLPDRAEGDFLERLPPLKSWI